jgi:hypothetical protein
VFTSLPGNQRAEDFRDFAQYLSTNLGLMHDRLQTLPSTSFPIYYSQSL